VKSLILCDVRINLQWRGVRNFWREIQIHQSPAIIRLPSISVHHPHPQTYFVSSYPNKQTRPPIFPSLSQAILSLMSTTNKLLYSVALVINLLSIAWSLSTSNQGEPKTALQVWDDVLPHANQRRTLHKFASQNGLGHACFSRPMKTKEGRNVIELALDAILSEIERAEADSEQTKPHYVEYWSRQEWRHIGEFYNYIFAGIKSKSLIILLPIANCKYSDLITDDVARGACRCR
jgi:hypothetical protein